MVAVSGVGSPRTHLPKLALLGIAAIKTFSPFVWSSFACMLFVHLHLQQSDALHPSEAIFMARSNAMVIVRVVPSRKA